MALLGQAAVAMWWDIAPEWREEFEEWHSREHFPERLAIPGFLRGSRWANARDGFFVFYELDAYETLTSPHYLARLNAPTPWSAKLMPHHRNMVRSLCRVVASFGGGIAQAMLTVRLSPAPDAADAFGERLRDLLSQYAAPVTGAHLLRTETPAHATTREQAIRGGDRAADWIVLAGAYDRAGLEILARALSEVAGAQPEPVIGLYTLRYSATPRDFA
jgi:hypothetical protein